jgi:hypothetical protein
MRAQARFVAPRFRTEFPDPPRQILNASCEKNDNINLLISGGNPPASLLSTPKRHIKVECRFGFVH